MCWTPQRRALFAHFRPTRAFIPVLLAALCGLRRGEVVALKWKHVDFASASLSVCESLEQTTSGIRRKETKGGRTRTVVTRLGDPRAAAPSRAPSRGAAQDRRR